MRHLELLASLPFQPVAVGGPAARHVEAFVLYWPDLGGIKAKRQSGDPQTISSQTEKRRFQAGLSQKNGYS
jgi:hypothetical protein